MRVEILQRFIKAGRLHRKLLALEKKLAATQRRHGGTRARLSRDVVRLRVKLSQAIRSIPFSPTKWTESGEIQNRR